MEDTLILKQKTEYWPLGWMLAFLGAAYGSVGFLTGELWFFLIPALVALVFAGLLLARTQFTLILGPEGITRRDLLGTAFIPRKSLGFFYGREYQVKAELYRKIWASSCTVEALAERRKAQLERGSMTRKELPFRLREPRWQEHFAREMMDRLSLKKDYKIFLGQGNDLLALLGFLYPEVPQWKIAEAAEFPVFAQPEPVGPFRRAWRSKESGEEAGWLVLFAIPLLLLGIGLAIQKPAAILTMAGISLAFWGIMTAVFRFSPQLDGDWLEPMPEGLAVRRKERDLLLRKEQITVIAEYRSSAVGGKCLAVAALPVAVMAERQTARMKKYPWVRRECQPMLALPDWQLRLAKSYMRSTARILWGSEQEIQFMTWSESRKERLRKAFPEAVFLEQPVWERSQNAPTAGGGGTE